MKRKPCTNECKCKCGQVMCGCRDSELVETRIRATSLELSRLTLEKERVE